jgi:ABC-type molybdate transport system substrate-binding protein
MVSLVAQPIYLRFNKKLLDLAGIEYPEDTITFWELNDIYCQVKQVTQEPLYLLNYGSYDPLVTYELPYYIQENALDSEEYIQYLQANKEMDYSETYRSRGSVTDDKIDDNVLCRMEWCFTLQTPELLNAMFSETDTLTEAVLYETHEKYPIINGSSLSISSFSQNKELAWEFIKFVMGDHDLSFFDIAEIPINKAKAERVYANAGISEDVRNRLFSDFEKLNIKGSVDSDLAFSLQPVLDNYYLYNLTSAEECAKQLSERVYLYLNE